MPTYEYKCKDCDHQFDVVQSFSDDALTTCPNCRKKALRKVFSPVGIVLKGSGFYKNDSRSGNGKSSASSTATTAEKSDSTSSSASSNCRTPATSMAAGFSTNTCFLACTAASA